jgi:hypothetical protein
MIVCHCATIKPQNRNKYLPWYYFLPKGPVISTWPNKDSSPRGDSVPHWAGCISVPEALKPEGVKLMVLPSGSPRFPQVWTPGYSCVQLTTVRNQSCCELNTQHHFAFWAFTVPCKVSLLVYSSILIRLWFMWSLKHNMLPNFLKHCILNCLVTKSHH